MLSKEVFQLLSVCQMCVRDIMLFEMYFMALCGNKPAVDYCTYIRAEVAQGCCAHQHLLSHIFMHETNVYIDEGQPFTAQISFMPFKKPFSFQNDMNFQTVRVHSAKDWVQKRRCFDREHRYSIKISFLSSTSVEVQLVSALETQDFILISTMSLMSTKNNQRKGSWEINVCHLSSFSACTHRE